MAETAISISGMTKKYDNIIAVDNLSLNIIAGEVFGFLGPNGAGKTTTIKIMAGVIRADFGSITAKGLDLALDPVSYKRQIGYIPDNPFFYPKLTAVEFLSFVASIYDSETGAFRKHSRYLLNYFDLEYAQNALIETYSRGMLQKLAIISVFARQPDLMLIDEPIVGLDPESVKKFKVLISEYVSGGKTVFLSTHILDIAEKICTRVGIIHLGKLRFVGTPAALRTKDNDANFEDIFIKLVSKS